MKKLIPLAALALLASPNTSPASGLARTRSATSICAGARPRTVPACPPRRAQDAMPRFTARTRRRASRQHDAPAAPAPRAPRPSLTRSKSRPTRPPSLSRSLYRRATPALRFNRLLGHRHCVDPVLLLDHSRDRPSIRCALAQGRARADAVDAGDGARFGVRDSTPAAEPRGRHALHEIFGSTASTRRAARPPATTRAKARSIIAARPPTASQEYVRRISERYTLCATLRARARPVVTARSPRPPTRPRSPPGAYETTSIRCGAEAADARHQLRFKFRV